MNTSHDSKGKFSSGNAGEAAHRQPQAGAPSGRFPVAPHVGTRSIGSHTGGHVVSALNERHMNFEPVASPKRAAVAESIARGQRADGKFARINKS